MIEGKLCVDIKVIKSEKMTLSDETRQSGKSRGCVMIGSGSSEVNGGHWAATGLRSHQEQMQQ